jgi:hypothetical protein
MKQAGQHRMPICDEESLKVRLRPKARQKDYL